MIYSNACAYAIDAMTRLALVRPDGYVLLDELCAGTDLPRHFVAKIFQDLVRKGLLLSAKGRGGGFALARAPSKISIYDIMAVVDGVHTVESCVLSMAECNDRQPCAMHNAWAPIRTQIKNHLIETSLQDLSRALVAKLKLLGQKIPPPKSKSKPVRIAC